MIDRLRSQLAAPYRRWLPAVLVGVAVLNLALTLFLPEHAQPVKWHGDPDLGLLVFEERDSVGIRFGIYEHMREALQGETLVVPAEGALDPHVARGLAGVTVESRDYAPEVDVAGLPIRSRGTYDGTGEVLEYLVLEGVASDWWEGVDGGRIVLVPSSVIPVPEATDG